MTDKIRDQLFEDTLFMMKEKFPEFVGTTPQWPRFDRFKVVYAAMEVSRLQFEQAIKDGNFNSAVVQICHTMSGFMTMAICMGVDTRPVMAAVHLKNMNDNEGELPIADLLDFQRPLITAPLETVTS